MPASNLKIREWPDVRSKEHIYSKACDETKMAG
jgi:hypothetical protein